MSQIRVSQIRVSQIRASQIRASQIRATEISSNHPTTPLLKHLTFICLQRKWVTRDPVSYPGIEWPHSLHYNRFYFRATTGLGLHLYGKTRRKSYCWQDICHNQFPVDDERSSYVFQHPGLKHLKQNYKVTNQTRKLMCTVLVLTNLAEPKLVVVPCSKKLGQAVYCLPKIQSPPVEQQNSTIFYCVNKTFLQIEHACYQFVWHKKSANERTVFETLSFAKSFHRFQTLFDAVSQVFPPILYPPFTHLFVFTKCSKTYKYRTVYVPSHIEVNAFLLVQRAWKATQLYKTVFFCINGTLLSVVNLCDGKKDCPGNDNSDEDGCNCSMSDRYSSKCKHLTNAQDPKRCSVFYFLSKSKTCKFYHEVETCNKQTNNTEIGVRYTQSRKNTTASYENGDTALCADEGKLSCQDDTKCYEIHQICVYQLDTSGVLFPCKEGSHMQNCKKFVCNAMFKCPSFYCIPWEFACDGKWDCPKGLDETCSATPTCQSLFKCQNTHICLHIIRVCDNVYDCPKKDDEFSCALKSFKCPSTCSCLLSAVHCYRGSLIHHQLVQLLLYQAVFMQSVKLHPNFPVVRHKHLLFMMKHCTIAVWCNLMQRMVSAIHIVLRQNSLQNITRNCFGEAKQVVFVRLDENKISSIEHNAFPVNHKLSVLNLSSNPLHNLASSAFGALCMITVLSIHNYSLVGEHSNPLDDTKVGILDTNSYILSCLNHLNMKHTAVLPWFMSCYQMLNSNEVRHVYWTVSVLICLLALTCLVVQKKFSVTGHEKATSAYKIQVASMNTLDLSFSFYCSALAMVDNYYGNVFVVYASLWKSSFFCFSLNTLFLNYSILSPGLLFLMSVSRLMVVISPMKTGFKKASFVKKCLVLISFTSLLFSSILTLILWATEGQVPNTLCVPYSDPLDSVVIVQVLAWIILLEQSCPAIAIAVMYIILLKQLKKSQEKVSQGRSKKIRFVPLLCQLVCLSTTNFLCWIPSGIVFVFALLKDRYVPLLLVLTIVLGTALNALVNPIIFIIMSARKQRN